MSPIASPFNESMSEDYFLKYVCRHKFRTDESHGHENSVQNNQFVFICMKAGTILYNKEYNKFL